jgi:hypothetical protein
MRRLTFVALGLVAVLAAAGCGGGNKAAAGAACGEVSPALSGAPALPKGFPAVDSVIYTKNAHDGPTESVSGYLPGEVADAFAAFRSAIRSASGYTVTKSKQGAVDAEVDFAGGSKTGQVKLVQLCKGRTGVTITASPGK